MHRGPLLSTKLKTTNLWCWFIIDKMVIQDLTCYNALLFFINIYLDTISHLIMQFCHDATKKSRQNSNRGFVVKLKWHQCYVILLQSMVINLQYLCSLVYFNFVLICWCILACEMFRYCGRISDFSPDHIVRGMNIHWILTCIVLMTYDLYTLSIISNGDRMHVHLYRLT